ncbi:MAG: hypothetical protein ACUVSX_16735 [Aggregatilineales bacterium]
MDEAIQITLSGLDPVARQTLAASAVLGNVTAHWLQYIISHEAREVERACDLLTDYGWFEFFGERYALAVPEVREIVLAGLTLATGSACTLRQPICSASTAPIRVSSRDSSLAAGLFYAVPSRPGAGGAECVAAISRAERKSVAR